MCGDEFSSVLFQLRDRLGQNEARLMDRRPEELRNQIEALKNKTEQNRRMARDAREAADAALRNSSDSEKVRPVVGELHPHVVLVSSQYTPGPSGQGLSPSRVLIHTESFLSQSQYRSHSCNLFQTQNGTQGTHSVSGKKFELSQKVPMPQKQTPLDKRTFKIFVTTFIFN